MSESTTKSEYLDMLREVAKEKNRLPKKSDFSEIDVNRIKSFFGPWPWALEEAGLKAPKKDKRIEKNRERRKARKALRSLKEDEHGL